MLCWSCPPTIEVERNPGATVGKAEARSELGRRCD
jgi:hypothetical protein